MSTAKVERNRLWRTAFLSPLLYFLGTCCWIAGAGLSVAAQPRTGTRLGGTNYIAAAILFIVASALWVMGALVSLVASHAEAALLVIGGKTPGLARLLVLAAWHELIGTILLLVGSCLYLAGSDGNSDTASAGTILWLIGAFVLLSGMTLLTVIALVVASVTSLMPEMLHRQRAWFSIAAQVFFTLGMLVFTIGAAAFVTLLGPGFQLFGSLLWLVAGGLWFVAFLARMLGAWYYFVPVLSFATAAAATSMLVAGTNAQVGLSGTAGSHAGSIESSKTVVTTDRRNSSSSTAPASTATAPNGTAVASNTGTSSAAHAENVQVAV